MCSSFTFFMTFLCKTCSFFVQACGGIYKAKDSNFHGKFVSPWYPDDYPNNIECVWELEALNGNGIGLSIQ